MRILNIGSLNIDKTYEVDHFVQPGETLMASSMAVCCGGKGLNQSIAAARAGAQLWHAGLVGNDGQALVDALVAAGVHTELLRRIDGQSGHAIIEVDPSGQNRILLFGGTNRMLNEKTIDGILDAFGEGMVLLQNEVNLLAYIVDAAYHRGLPVALNAAPMNDDVLGCELSHLGWLIINEIEGRQVAQCERDEDILPALSRRYPSLKVLLTLGERGAVVLANGTSYTVGSCHVAVRDTTAAGDTFIGYFLRGIDLGWELGDCLRFATGASAISVTREGASTSIPSFDEVKRFVSSHNDELAVEIQGFRA